MPILFDLIVHFSYFSGLPIEPTRPGVSVSQAPLLLRLAFDEVQGLLQDHFQLPLGVFHA